jgi:crossover junction endodeoxyribonuclease RuvC
MRTIGLDNGLDGGIVVIDETGRVLEKHVTPVLGIEGKGKRIYDVPAMLRLLGASAPPLPGAKAFLEKAQAMPGQGVSSMFSIGYGYGLWTALLTALGIPFEVVHPRTWQGVMFQGINRDDTKKASALVASRLSPSTDWRATERSRVPHDGLTDAFCIAEYGRCLQKR